MSSTNRDVDHALAYPEPPASSLWHRHGPQAQPITPEEQRRNRELLELRKHGLEVISARNTAMLEAVADLPPIVISDLFGVSAGSAHRWARPPRCLHERRPEAAGEILKDQ